MRLRESSFLFSPDTPSNSSMTMPAAPAQMAMSATLKAGQCQLRQ